MKRESSRDLLRPTWAEIDLGAIRRNAHRIHELAKKKEVDWVAVVKADGYGHGAIRVAQEALSEGAAMLAVALVEEGIALRRAGIRAPILVMGAYIPGTAHAYAEHELGVTLSDVAQADALAREAQGMGGRLVVHIKVDTGMGRLGVLPAHALALAGRVRSAEGLLLEGVFSHLATADEPDLTYTKEQLRAFTGVLQRLSEAGIQPRWRHILNTGGLLQHDPGATNMARVGLALYGLAPSDHLQEGVGLLPAMTFRTQVNAVKEVPAGTFVSYGRRYRTRAMTKLATIPVGYADGMSRLLSGKIFVDIRGRRFPVVGSICMDQAVIDVGGAAVTPGDTVVLFGRAGDEYILPDEWAAALGTINYEIVCMVSARVPRLYTGV